jgi:hypothetical protein
MAISAYHLGPRWARSNTKSYPLGATHSTGSTRAGFHTWQLTDSDGLMSWPLNTLPAHRRQPPHHGLAIGHRRLYCLLFAHDTLRRHGVTAAFRLLIEEQIADALDACAYFDLHDLAAAIAEIPLAAASPVSARVFDAEYRRRFTMTDRIVTAIREHVATRTDDFPTDAT